MRVVIAHGHIFKNAGSTFDWSLQRNFTERFLDHREDKEMRQRGSEHLKELLEAQSSLVAVSSHHMCLPPRDLIECRIERAYLLRHPLERIASVYAFERQQDSDSAGSRAAKSMEFQDYVHWRMTPGVARTIRDYQTFYLAGMPRIGGKQPINQSVFTLALESLAEVNCLGVVERYDESMVVFEHYLRQDFPDIDLAYVMQNVTQGKGSAVECRTTEVLERLGKLQGEVLANNSYDLALYRAGNQKLDVQIAGIPGFNEKLEKFRARCRCL